MIIVEIPSQALWGQVKSEFHSVGYPEAPVHPVLCCVEQSPTGCRQDQGSHWLSEDPYPLETGICGWKCHWHYHPPKSEGGTQKMGRKWEEQRGHERHKGEKRGREPVKETEAERSVLLSKGKRRKLTLSSFRIRHLIPVSDLQEDLWIFSWPVCQLPLLESCSCTAGTLPTATLTFQIGQTSD